ncbi:UNVERIFIED_CONTAM: hypothetical protein Slati_3786600 [Sesamum latifolium]|uniref:Uncharacterized protein n=1 Tax=Sesamum latifolium TaxID=2727402 RepID=A0AAW2U4B8_9LAMI
MLVERSPPRLSKISDSLKSRKLSGNVSNEQCPNLARTSIKSFNSSVRVPSSTMNFVSLFSMVSFRLPLKNPAKEVYSRPACSGFLTRHRLLCPGAGVDGSKDILFILSNGKWRLQVGNKNMKVGGANLGVPDCLSSFSGGNRDAGRLGCRRHCTGRLRRASSSLSNLLIFLGLGHGG